MINQRELTQAEINMLEQYKKDNPLFECAAITIGNEVYYVRNIGYVEYRDILNELHKKRWLYEAKLSELRNKYKDNQDTPEFYKEFAEVGVFNESEEMLYSFVSKGLLGPEKVIEMFKAGTIPPMILMVLYDKIYELSMLEDIEIMDESINDEDITSSN